MQESRSRAVEPPPRVLLIVSTNPSVDRTLEVPRLEVGHVQRATGVCLGAGGKGLNVARAARTLGLPCRVTGFLAGHTGALVEDLAREEGLEAEWLHLSSGETRTCLLLNHADGDATVINEPGPEVTPEHWARLEELVERLATGASGVAFAGSLPPGVDGEAYAALCRRLARRTGRVFVDSSTRHLDAVVREPRGLVIKVNRQELAAAVGRSLDEPGRLLAECRALVGAGAVAAVATLGAAGAVAATPEGAWRVEAPPVPLVSSVGSGDAFLAGLAAAALRGQPMPAALQLAAACGAANASTRLPARFAAGEVEALSGRVRVEPAG